MVHVIVQEKEDPIEAITCTNGDNEQVGGGCSKHNDNSDIGVLIGGSGAGDSEPICDDPITTAFKPSGNKLQCFFHCSPRCLYGRWIRGPSSSVALPLSGHVERD